MTSSEEEERESKNVPSLPKLPEKFDEDFLLLVNTAITELSEISPRFRRHVPEFISLGKEYFHYRLDDPDYKRMAGHVLKNNILSPECKFLSGWVKMMDASLGSKRVCFPEISCPESPGKFSTTFIKKLRTTRWEGFWTMENATWSRGEKFSDARFVQVPGNTKKFSCYTLSAEVEINEDTLFWKMEKFGYSLTSLPSPSYPVQRGTTSWPSLLSLPFSLHLLILLGTQVGALSTNMAFSGAGAAGAPTLQDLDPQYQVG
jgi:hypothetical protein